MKKKLFFLVLLTFLLCGCSANVDITIKDSIVSESISINESPYGQATLSDIKQQYRNYIPAFKDEIIVDTMPDKATTGVEYYKFTGNEYYGSYYAYYKYDYNFKDYKNATSINNAFKSSAVQYDSYEKEILFTTESSGMLLFSSYPQLDEVKINITTDYKVKENNADYVNGNVYTWIFNKDTKKSVYLLLEDTEGKILGSDDTEEDSKTETDNSKTSEDKKSTTEDSQKEQTTTEKIKSEGSKHPYILVFIFLGLFLLFVIISLNIKKV